ncbi:MAG: hypothetical protein WBW79_04590 [Desulfocapsaceae bacterium]
MLSKSLPGIKKKLQHWFFYLGGNTQLYAHGYKTLGLHMIPGIETSQYAREGKGKEQLFFHRLVLSFQSYNLNISQKRRRNLLKSFIIQLVKGKTKEGFAIAKCTTPSINFTTCKRRLVQADFSGGDITSADGVVLLPKMDNRLDLNSSIAQHLSDNRL